MNALLQPWSCRWSAWSRFDHRWTWCNERAPTLHRRLAAPCEQPGQEECIFEQRDLAQVGCATRAVGGHGLLQSEREALPVRRACGQPFLA
mmetsp:Transcript_36648/g.105605  ORF Transcript_36648/g.105605 Transcript_36648/m.105605 type:complete len:91 (+) Transcript_36648:1266-1538(+)